MSSAIASPAPATANSTAACTHGHHPDPSAKTQDGTTTERKRAEGKNHEKPCAASNDAYPTSSTERQSATQRDWGRPGRTPGGGSESSAAG